MHILYSLLLTFAFVLALPCYLWKGRATGKYLRTFRERMGRLPVYLERGRRPLHLDPRRLGGRGPGRPAARARAARSASRATASSSRPPPSPATRVAQKSVRGVDGLFYAPFDFPRPVRPRPRRRSTRRCSCWSRRRSGRTSSTRRAGAGTRVAVVNGRLSPRSFPRYRRVRRFLRRCSRGRPLPDAGRGPRRAHPRAGRAAGPRPRDRAT